jgi:PST family polysaccharide transporter
MLLAGPGVLATLTFASLVISVFYDRTFADAVDPLRWICLGMALRVAVWPMGYIVLAQGANAIFFWTEVAATVVHVGLGLTLARWFGVTGAAMGFVGLYIWHGLLIYIIVRKLTGFRWSSTNTRIMSWFFGAILAVFLGFLGLPLWAATGFGLIATIVACFYSLSMIANLVSLDRVPAGLRRATAWLHALNPAGERIHREME